MIVFDIETGGLQMHHPVIQIAAFDGTDTFERKIQFDPAKCDATALKLNHFTTEAWTDALHEGVVVEEFSEWLRLRANIPMISKRTGSYYTVARLAAYNAGFDGPRLTAMFARQAAFLPAHPIIMCVMQRFLWWLHETGTPAENVKLSTAAVALGIVTDSAHDALADVKTAYEVMRRCRGGE